MTLASPVPNTNRARAIERLTDRYGWIGPHSLHYIGITFKATKPILQWLE
jgi:hypothetical protein